MTRILSLILALFEAWNLGIGDPSTPTVLWEKEDDRSPKLHIVDLSARRRSNLILLHSLGIFQLTENHKQNSRRYTLLIPRPPGVIKVIYYATHAIDLYDAIHVPNHHQRKDNWHHISPPALSLLAFSNID